MNFDWDARNRFLEKVDFSTNSLWTIRCIHMKKDVDLLCVQLCMYFVCVAGVSISMNLCVFICVYVCLLYEVHMFSCGSFYIYICAWKCIYPWIYMCVCVSTYVHVYMWKCVCICVCACKNLCEHMHVNICSHVRMRVLRDDSSFCLCSVIHFSH